MTRTDQSYTMRAFQRSGPVTLTELEAMRERLWRLVIRARQRLDSHDRREVAARKALAAMDALIAALRRDKTKGHELPY